MSEVGGAWIMSHGGNNLVAQFVLNYNQCCTPLKWRSGHCVTIRGITIYFLCFYKFHMPTLYRVATL